MLPYLLNLGVGERKEEAGQIRVIITAVVHSFKHQFILALVQQIITKGSSLARVLGITVNERICGSYLCVIIK